MTFEQAFESAVAQFDRAAATLRAMIADPNHVNAQSAEMKQAWHDLGCAGKDVARVKEVWNSARARTAPIDHG